MLLQKLLVRLGDRVEQLAAPLLGQFLEVGRDLLDLVRLALARVPAPGQRAHVDQVDDPDEVGLGTDRQLDDQRLGPEAVDDRLDREVEVGAQLVHLVDEADARDVVLVGLTPDRLRLRLDTLLAVEHRDRAVEDAQVALDLDGEVDVPGGVDQVDLVAFPEAGGGSRGNGDTPLLLLLHPVHRGGASWTSPIL